MTYKEVEKILTTNSWTIEDVTTDNYQISAFNIYNYFYVFIDIKKITEGKFKYQITQTLQNKNEEENVFSYLHFYTNNLEELIIKLGKQNLTLDKTNYVDHIKDLSKLDIDILGDDMKGKVFKLNF